MELDNNTIEIDWNSYGVLVKIADGIATIEGLNDVLAGGRVIIGDGIEALVLNIENRYSKAVIFGNERDIQQNDLVQRTNSIMSIPIGLNILGRHATLVTRQSTKLLRRTFSSSAYSAKHQLALKYGLDKDPKYHNLAAEACYALSSEPAVQNIAFCYIILPRVTALTTVEGLLVSEEYHNNLSKYLNDTISYAEYLDSGFHNGNIISIQVRWVETEQDFVDLEAEGRNNFEAEILFAVVTDPVILERIKQRFLLGLWKRLPLLLSKEDWQILSNQIDSNKYGLDLQLKRADFFNEVWYLVIFAFIGKYSIPKTEPFTEVEYRFLKALHRIGNSEKFYSLCIQHLNSPVRLFSPSNNVK